ncbi:MAG: protein kinase [Acidobacteriota bacterium]
MDAQNANLLVVDDIAENRDMLSRRLARRGFRVHVAEDGPSALDLVKSEDVDLVLLDIMMPGMDGIEVLERLRRDHDQAQLPVIMVTAKDGSEDVVRALDRGANDYITKPIDFPVVLARVQKELRTRSSARAAAPKPVESSPGKLETGALLGGRYRLGEPLGHGNFGTVYSGHHLELDLPVAVKVLDTRLNAGEDSLARFRSEGRSACRVQHPNAVTVFDFSVSDEGVAYLVMELLEGRPLSKELATWRKLSPRRANEILQPICAVLAEAHAQDVIHRDIKPENIYLQRRQGAEQIKVLDFGIAKLVGEHATRENLTAEGFILGTPAYMAPERLRDAPYDGSSDTYSVGIMLFQMLAGRLPFQPKQGDSMALLMMHLEQEPPALRDFEPSIPEAIEALVLECMAKDPGNRPPILELARRFAEQVGPDTGTDDGDPLGSGKTRAVDSEALKRVIDEGTPTRTLSRPQVDGGGKSSIGRWFSRLFGKGEG